MVAKPTLIHGYAHHAECNTRLEVETRTIIAQPNDINWPRDTQPGVFYCPTCKRVVDVREVSVTL